ncbi:ABC transporter permease [Croceitalea sp. MTPC9]|uniref:ABC transporter permease n=1 Tax=unclassified Croceitalea TaxID=2632280 RepID=UPI002B3D9195|nr:ABC transporter permease [Croceitalea sp. MTPC6]GMN16656.1 ABC transporter permease [Croceitalea sp. MTPC9]
MNFSFYIAKRYLRSKSSQSAVNIINFITFLVIVIGSAALFVVLSAFAGLKTFSLQFTNTFDPDLKAIPTTGKFFSISPENEKSLSQLEGIANYSKEIEERVYLTFREKGDLAYIKGVDENYRSVTGIDSTLYFGNWGVTEYNAVLGIGIYNSLGVPMKNYRTPLQVLAPKPGKGSFSPQSLNTKLYNDLPLVISGVYAIEEGLDKKYVIAQLHLVQGLLEKDSTKVSGVNFKLNGSIPLEDARLNIKNALGEKAIVLTRRELNGTLYKMLNTENLATYLIFTLVLIIALFNVVGAIIMMILDKQQNSKTFFALGTTIKELRRIYFVQGVSVTTIGGLIGVLIGSILIGSQLAFEWLKITPSLAYPVEYSFANVLVVLATIVVLGLISSRIASSRISKKLVEL